MPDHAQRPAVQHPRGEPPARRGHPATPPFPPAGQGAQSTSGQWRFLPRTREYRQRPAHWRRVLRL